MIWVKGFLMSLLVVLLCMLFMYSMWWWVGYAYDHFNDSKFRGLIALTPGMGVALIWGTISYVRLHPKE